MKKPISRVLLLSLAFLAGCLGGPGLQDYQANLAGEPDVTTSAASYTTGQAIEVAWTDLTDNANDWIAIAPAGSEYTVVTSWVYTGGMADGMHTFGGVENGTYVARAFLDDGYTLQDESPSFEVTGAAPGTVSADQATYSFDDSIVVTWSSLPGNATDWIAIAPQGSPAMTATRWVYTGGQASGSFAFEAPSTGGSFVARAFISDSYNMVGESPAFAVGLTVSTSKSAYTTVEPVIVSWENMPTNQFDWIAIAPAGSPMSTVTTWVYTNGASTSQNTFGALAAGTYVARGFLDNSYALLDETAEFTVGSGGGSVTVSSDASTYTTGQDITVTWSGLPGNANDWIAIAPDGSADSSVTVWVYTAGQAAGSTTFVGGLTTPGTYVARAFEDDSYSKLGQSSTFDVQ